MCTQDKTNFKGIIFDMDGTMVDNMMIHHRAWQQKLAQLGLPMSLEEVKAKVHGVNLEILERLFGDRFTPEERQRISFEKEEAYRQIYKPNLKLLPGLRPLLDQLKAANIPMAIGTAAPPENADFILDTLQLRSYFSTVLHSDSVTKGKPHPEIFIKAAQGLGLNAQECLVFEDSLTGAETALNASCPAIIVTTTHAQEEFAAFPHIRRFISNYLDIDLQYLQNEFNFKNN